MGSPPTSGISVWTVPSLPRQTRPARLVRPGSSRRPRLGPGGHRGQVRLADGVEAGLLGAMGLDRIGAGRRSTCRRNFGVRQTPCRCGTPRPAVRPGRSRVAGAAPRRCAGRRARWRYGRTPCGPRAARCRRAATPRDGKRGYARRGSSRRAAVHPPVRRGELRAKGLGPRSGEPGVLVRMRSLVAAAGRLVRLRHAILTSTTGTTLCRCLPERTGTADSRTSRSQPL